MKHSRRVQNALEHFQSHYDQQDGLAMWQGLCEDVGVPPGRSTTQCKKAMSKSYINIYDFVEARRTNARVFASYKALCNYTKAGKIFPLVAAKEDPVLRFLLVEIR